MAARAGVERVRPGHRVEGHTRSGRIAPAIAGSRLRRLVAVFAVAAVLTAACSGKKASVRSLPEGFVDELVAKVEAPTDLAFAPDGRVFVTTQPGALRVIRNGRLLPRPALDITSRVCRERERGLVGATFDPRFASNHFVYIYYTFKKFGGCPSDTDKVPVNRAVRYRLRGDSTLDPRSARILIDNVPSFHAIHNAGDLAFGKDGYLYLSIGDGGRDYARRTVHSSTNAAARDQNVLLGKIIRITRAGRPAPGNPFTGPGTVRCATTGPVTPGLRCREIYAWGLRNPFRFSFDPNAAGTRFFVNDVGENTWEEVNAGRRGADYGWNLREGFCPVHGRVRCGPAPPHLTDPVLAYAHRAWCGAGGSLPASITGGAFVPNGVWPREYDGTYLFADFVCGKIFVMDREGHAMTTFADRLTIPSVTSMTFGPVPTGQALYYTTFARGGEVRRIVNRP